MLGAPAFPTYLLSSLFLAMFNSPSCPFYNRAKGAFYGNLVGDALGAPVEFQARDSYPPVCGMQECRTWGLPAGSFTDDGSMMLCLAASLVNTGGVHDAANVLSHYLAWYLEGYMSVNDRCFDIGYTTRASLDDFMTEGLLEARQGGRQTAGNGSVMRIAPIPIAAFRRAAEGGADALDLDAVWSTGAASSRVTHSDPIAVWGAGFWSALTALAIKGASKAELLAWIRDIPYNSLPAARHYPLAWKRVVDGEFMRMPRESVRSSGYVVDTCEAALWAFFGTDSFAEGACAAVNLGKDTDTVGAVYGILAGGFYGYDGIPTDWLATLQRRDMVDAVWWDFGRMLGMEAVHEYVIDFAALGLTEEAVYDLWLNEEAGTERLDGLTAYVKAAFGATIRRGDFVVCDERSMRSTEVEGLGGVFVWNGERVIDLHGDRRLDEWGLMPPEFEVSETEFSPTWFLETMSHTGYTWFSGGLRAKMGASLRLVEFDDGSKEVKGRVEIAGVSYTVCAHPNHADVGGLDIESMRKAICSPRIPLWVSVEGEDRRIMVLSLGN